MDINKVVEILAEKGLLTDLENKRLTTSPLPITLYLKLCRAELATGKDIAANIGTALHTYVARNGENHDQEINAIALTQGKTPEEVLADWVASRIERLKQRRSTADE